MALPVTPNTENLNSIPVSRRRNPKLHSSPSQTGKEAPAADIYPFSRYLSRSRSLFPVSRIQFGSVSFLFTGQVFTYSTRSIRYPTPI